MKKKKNGFIDELDKDIITSDDMRPEVAGFYLKRKQPGVVLDYNPKTANRTKPLLGKYANVKKRTKTNPQKVDRKLAEKFLKELGVRMTTKNTVKKVTKKVTKKTTKKVVKKSVKKIVGKSAKKAKKTISPIATSSY